jgi:hypothetical protein
MRILLVSGWQSSECDLWIDYYSSHFKKYKTYDHCGLQIDYYRLHFEKYKTYDYCGLQIDNNSLHFEKYKTYTYCSLRMTIIGVQSSVHGLRMTIIGHGLRMTIIRTWSSDDNYQNMVFGWQSSDRGLRMTIIRVWSSYRL